MSAADPPVLHTLGHSTRSTAELLELLAAADVRTLADVRRFPASRRHPQLGRAALEASLGAAGLGYAWLGESLGGRQPERLPPDRSPNAGWTQPAFRRYADAMETPAFRMGLERLEALARAAPTALMCAERPWWKCHRRLLADVLVARGWRVVHWMEPDRSSDHALTPFARVEGERVTYPALL